MDGVRGNIYSSYAHFYKNVTSMANIVTVSARDSIHLYLQYVTDMIPAGQQRESTEEERDWAACSTSARGLANNEKVSKLIPLLPLDRAQRGEYRRLVNAFISNWCLVVGTK